jgi:hypothetical protein
MDSHSSDLVSLNHRLLDEISQVQLKMVDVLQENFRLKSEIDQLKRLVNQLEMNLDERATGCPRTGEKIKFMQPIPGSGDVELRWSVNEMADVVNRYADTHKAPLEYFPPPVREKAPGPLIKSPFLSRILHVNSQPILDPARSLSDRMRSADYHSVSVRPITNESGYIRIPALSTAVSSTANILHSESSDPSKEAIQHVDEAETADPSFVPPMTLSEASKTLSFESRTLLFDSTPMPPIDSDTPAEVPRVNISQIPRINYSRSTGTVFHI